MLLKTLPVVALDEYTHRKNDDWVKTRLPVPPVGCTRPPNFSILWTDRIQNFHIKKRFQGRHLCQKYSRTPFTSLDKSVFLSFMPTNPVCHQPQVKENQHYFCSFYIILHLHFTSNRPIITFQLFSFPTA